MSKTIPLRVKGRRKEKLKAIGIHHGQGAWLSHCYRKKDRPVCGRGSRFPVGGGRGGRGQRFFCLSPASSVRGGEADIVGVNGGGKGEVVYCAQEEDPVVYNFRRGREEGRIGWVSAIMGGGAGGGYRRVAMLFLLLSGRKKKKECLRRKRHEKRKRRNFEMTERDTVQDPERRRWREA